MRALLVFSALLLLGVGVRADPVCQNGGTPKQGEETCKCTDNWTGDLCDVIKCANGGIPSKDDASKCECQSYWSGDFCETIDCVNGGYENDGSCHCPKGYYGIHCDAVKQARPVEGVFTTKKTFNLYIHNELTDWYGMKALKRIKSETRTILQDPSYDSYDLFNLFVSKREPSPTTEMPKQFVDRDVFLKALDDMEATRTRHYSCDPSEELSYEKLHDALKSNSIEDSVILMFTQYPPKSDPVALPLLKEYLRAFRIKLNVIIGADDILLDCNSKKNNKGAKFDELTELVHFTDGEIATFLIEDDDSPDELLPSFIKASARPQSHSRAASEGSCSGLAFEFQTDPYPNTYYIAVRTQQDDGAVISGTCSSGGEVTLVAFSEYQEFALSSIVSGAQQTCKLTVTSAGGCLATVYSVGGKKDVDQFEIFHSFSTSEEMDSDSIHSFKSEEVYLTMHIDVTSGGDELPKYRIVEFGGVVMVKNEKEEQTVFEKDLINRTSTFNYQSEFPFNCPADGTSWIQLELDGFNVNGELVAVLNRIIHLNCEERKAAVDPSPKLFRLMDDAVTTKKPTLALMYSNRIPTPQFSKFILESADEGLMKDKFSQYGYLRFDGNDIMSFVPYPPSKFDDFRKGVYDNAPDITLGEQDNLKQHLQKLTEVTETSITSDSLVSIAIDHSMIDPTVSQGNQYPSNLAQLSNLGAKLLFWGDVDTVKIEEESDSLEYYTRLAAVSAGHVILMDTEEFTDEEDENGDQPFYMSLALRDMYSFGPSQRLLAYSNLEWIQTSTSTTQSAPIGTLQVPGGTSEVFVSLTLNVKNPSDVGQAFMLSIVLEGVQDRKVLNIDDFTKYGEPSLPRSNLYTAKIPVVGGESYEGTFTVLAMTPYTGAHIRLWTSRTDEDVLPDLTYADFDKKIIQPDDYLGAALRVDSVGEMMSLRFLDENGIEGKLQDHNQTVDVVGGVAHFVPYFCVSAQSTSLSKDMYTVEITYDNGFKYFRPLLCSKSTQTPDGNCKKEEGGVGDWYCSESNPPFHRGPSRQLIDCSGVGQVVYSDDKDAEFSYKCVCEEGFDGKSCEQSSCAAGIEHLPEEEDASFRTLSYVLLSPAGEDACSQLAMFYADEAKQFFDKTNEYDNIWQYTFSVYFTDGTAKTLYRGPSFNDFNDVFGKMSVDNVNFDPLRFCGNATNARPIDLNDVFNVAVESAGRNSRGIVFFYAVQTFADELEKNELNTAFASNELYQSIQAYQQHIYIVTPTMTPEFITITTASGGIAVRMQNDWNGGAYTTSLTNYRETFANILKSEIGWAGMLSEAQHIRSVEELTLSWTIRQAAELFVTSTPNTNRDHPAVTTSDGPPLAFTYDDDYEWDTSVSSHLSIVASDTPVTITFAANQDYGLVQVVIITKENPIRNALIGQSQAKTDKQAAGATNSSEKAVHISFNKPDSEMFFKPTDDNWRQASRINCSFSQEFVAFTQPFESIGAYVVDFTVSPVDSVTEVPDDGKSFSLSVPLAVSEEIDCVNGDFLVEGSYCGCDSGWSGPTCSQPSCGEGGKLNSHGDHCDCSGAPFGGLFCKE